MKERLHKALARAGVASRRHVEKMITEGHIRVNGKPVDQLGTQIDPDKDEVFVDGKRVQLSSDEIYERVYFLLNKPPKVLTTSKDERGRKTVLDLVLGAAEGRIYPVGRLDYDAEGALLLTNDGELTNQLIHPRHKVPKTYMVKVKGVPAEDKLDKLRRGIYLEDGPTGPCEIEVVSKAKVNTWVRVVLTQGKNRQIKRMFWRIEHPVQRLVRSHFGGISTKGLEPGQYRALTKRELTYLRAQSSA
jgi:pseudouridine synthase